MVGVPRASPERSPWSLLPRSLGLKAPLRSSNWIFGPYKPDVDVNTSHPLFKAMRHSPTNLGFLFQICSTPLSHLCLQTPSAPPQQIPSQPPSPGSPPGRSAILPGGEDHMHVLPSLSRGLHETERAGGKIYRMVGAGPSDFLVSFSRLPAA